jgi:hypothetical protein
LYLLSDPDVAGLKWANTHFLGWEPKEQSAEATAAVVCGLWDYEKSWRRNLSALQVLLAFEFSKNVGTLEQIGS